MALELVFELVLVFELELVFGLAPPPLPPPLPPQPLLEPPPLLAEEVDENRKCGRRHPGEEEIVQELLGGLQGCRLGLLDSTHVEQSLKTIEIVFKVARLEMLNSFVESLD